MVGADAVEGNMEDALRKVETDVMDDGGLSCGGSIGWGSRRGERAGDGGIESDCPSSLFSATNDRLVDEILVGRGPVNHGCARILGMVNRFDGFLTIIFLIRSRDSTPSQIKSSVSAKMRHTCR